MRNFTIPSSLFLPLVFVSAVAQAQWTETTWSQVNENYYDYAYGQSNPGTVPIWVFGAYTHTWIQEVSDSWWSNDQEEFGSSPNWRTGYNPASYEVKNVEIEWSDYKLNPGQQVKITIEMTKETGTNTWSYYNPPRVGTWTRSRNWSQYISHSISTVNAGD
jgi:hypothetical protein